MTDLPTPKKLAERAGIVLCFWVALAMLMAWLDGVQWFDFVALALGSLFLLKAFRDSVSDSA